MRQSSLLLVVMLLVIGFGGRQAKAQQWVRDFNDPMTVQVQFYGFFNCLGAFHAVLGGVSVGETNDVETCSQEGGTLSTPLGLASLECYKTYEIGGYGDSVYSMDLYVLPPEPKHDLETSAGSGMRCFRPYQIFIWDTLTKKWEKFCEATHPTYNTENPDDNPSRDLCDGASKTWKIQIRPGPVIGSISRPGGTDIDADEQADEAWLAESDATDPKTVAGDGQPIRMSAGKIADPASINFAWAVSAGRFSRGLSAGKVRLSGTSLSAAVFTPSVLTYVPTSDDTNDVVTIYTNDTTIAQVKTCQILLQAHVLSTNSYELLFYPASAVTGQTTNGFTLASGASSFVTWTIDSPDGTLNKWRLRETRYGFVRTNQLEYATNGIWTLTQGTGPDARVETRTITFNPSGNVTKTNRVEVQEIRNGAGTVCLRNQETYHAFPWGFSQRYVTADPGGSNLLTQFSYGTTTNDPAYGKLTQIQYPDGFWERRIYADTNASQTVSGGELPVGALYRLVHPWKNTVITNVDNDCLVSQYHYPVEGGFRLQKWHDSLGFDELDLAALSRVKSAVYEEKSELDQDVCATEGDTFETHTLGSLQQYGVDVVTHYSQSPSAHLNGRPLSKRSDVGSFDEYHYEFGSWNAASQSFSTSSAWTNDIRQVIYHGAGDVNSTAATLIPAQSTIDMKVVAGGNLVARETYLYTGATNYTLLNRILYARDALGHVTNIVRIDPATSERHVLYQADWTGGRKWSRRP